MSFLDDPETLKAFIDESREHLDGIEDDLLAIEAAGAAINVDLVNKVFRAVHSIKGGAGFLGLEKVKELAHSSENIMGLIRNQDLVPTPEIVSVLLDAVDLLAKLIHSPETSNEADISREIEALHAIAAGQAPTPREKTAATPPPGAAPRSMLPGSALFSASKEAMLTTLNAGSNLFVVDLPSRDLGTVLSEMKEIGEIMAASSDPLSSQGPLTLLFSSIMEEGLLLDYLGGAGQVRLQRVTAEQLENLASLPSVGTTMPVTRPKTVPAARPPQGETLPAVKAAPPPAEPPSGPKGEGSIRVNVRLLDNLMTLAGELVLTRNQLVQAVVSRRASGIDTISQRLDHITSELQEAIMSTRMQPVGNVFNKFKRIVRDLSKSLGKEVDLIIKGEDVELDKTIIESIGDPLTHLIRNSVDHGIEDPGQRTATGKPATGTLRLTAYHEGGHVMITIEDDGAGINTERVKEKVLAMGAFDAAALEAMSQKELAKLIFLPGLSTAKQVSDVSGRGVGMDVVQTNISKVGGTIDIESSRGTGTLITIKLPLTLAIIPSLIVCVQGERFAIPQVNLVELVRIPAAKVKDRIEKIGDALVMRLRGELLPLIMLSNALGIKETLFLCPESGERRPERRKRVMDRRFPSDPAGSVDDTEEKRARRPDRREHPASAYNVLVVTAGEYHYGIIVDQLLDSEEIVVKPLGSHLRDCKCYAGATIQGDGRVALILDIVGVSHIMQLNTVSQTVKEQALQKKADDLARLKDLQPLLLVRNAEHDQMAIPLDLVSRIEKISRASIEITGGRRNIQYRGGSLPLFRIDEVAKVASLNEGAETFYVVVFPIGGKEVGILLGEIVDIVTAEIEVDEMTHKQPGILGSAILLNQITLLVDLYSIVITLMPQWNLAGTGKIGAARSARILIVEDSSFFRNQIAGFVKEAGHTPILASDGMEGLNALAQNAVDLILTDIEMPNMNGLQMTENIRQNPKWKTLPIIAVTSLAGEEAERRGQAAGVDQYLVKLDREKIIAAINKHLNL